MFLKRRFRKKYLTLLKNSKYIPPQFKKEAFHCPHCNTHAAQDWENDTIFLKALFDYQRQFFLDDRQNIDEYSQRAIKVFLTRLGAELEGRFINLRCRDNYWLATCSLCKDFSIWIDEKMVYPPTSLAPLPAEDMPGAVKNIYEEARQVHMFSPRASAALLRVATEKLTEHLGVTEGNLNTRIKKLEEQGLSKSVIRMLHIVRIYANEGGSHAGQIDLTGEDNQEVVMKLFKFVNLIVQDTITRKNEEDEMFDNMPKDKKAGIENRDNNQNMIQ